jgi:uncharacterized phage protein (TIGR01671 family)
MRSTFDFGFRAWDDKEKEMYYGVNLYADSWVGCKIDEDRQIMYPPAQIKLMQCVGILDKNHKKIYEGDVLLKVSTASLFEVYYSENTACFRVKRQDGWHFDLKEIFPINDWKVVGNIYDEFDWDL